MPDNPSFPTGTVTFLFSDVEGSTELLQRLGERYDRVLNAHNRILREAFTTHAGVEVGTEGDSFFVVFPSARSAVEAALAAQRGLAAHDFGDGVKVRVRMGLHTGEGRLVDGNYRGLDVHRAARIAAAGHGGQVLVSETTRALVEGSPGQEIGFTYLGEHHLKDLEHPDHLYQLTAEGLQSAFPPPRSVDSRPHNLVAPVSSFVGREQQVRDVRKLLRDNRLVTLTGPGGTGKSRLSVQVGFDLLPHFRDGVFLVTLAGISDPDLVPAAAAQALGVRQQGVGSLESAVRQHLASRDLLLILDNFEHVLSAAFFVSDLMASTTLLKILVTSRAPLRLSSEQEYPVPPLSLPPESRPGGLESLRTSEAVTLFLQRARAVRPDFQLTRQNAEEIARICRRLDGLPLALELAAARIRTLEPSEVARRLDRSLSLLTGGARDLPARQQTLRNAIAWSYDLLEPPLQDLFSKLGVFAGGFSLEAAEAICCDDALDQLEVLAEQSLVRTTLDQFGARYVMLNPVREYAREKLESTGAAAETLRRHAEYFLDLAERAGGELQGPSQVEWLRRLESENDNLRAVMGWALANGEDRIAARLGWALWMFWWLHGHHQEGRTSMEALLRREPADAERCRAVAVAGAMAVVQADHATANAWFREGIALARQIGDVECLAFCLQSLGLSCLNTMEWDEATSALQEALALYEQQGNLMMSAGSRTNLGTAAFMQGRLEEAEKHTGEGLALARRLGDPLGKYFGLYTLAQVAMVRGDLGKAAGLLKEGLAVVAEVGNPTRMTYYLQTYGMVLGVTGDPLKFARLLGASEALRAKGAVPRYVYLEPPPSLMEQALAAAQEALGEEGFERAREEGRSLTPQQAAAYALDRSSWEEATLSDGPFRAVETGPYEMQTPAGRPRR